MKILKFIREYWVQIIFITGCVRILYRYIKNSNEAMRCSLRNDILNVYSACHKNRQITKYQLECIEYSYAAYQKLKGNSFIKNIVEDIRKYEIID